MSERINDQITETLCEFAEQIKFSDLPENVVEQTKKFIADYYAASIAGFWINAEFNDSIISVLSEFTEDGQCSVLFNSKYFPLTYAAYLNAIFAHGADMDDGNKRAAGHIGASVISAVLALADKLVPKWEDVLLAINVGYEFFNRIVGSAQPGIYNKGFHSTGVGGSIAAAAACAKLLGLETSQIYSSVSLAAVQSGGLIIIDESGQCSKPLNPANAARIGLEAALYASRGARSPVNPLESKKGWYNAFTDSVNDKILLNGLGDTFTICESYLKLYPTCRHTHSSIDASIRLHHILLDKFEEKTLDVVNRIRKVDVYIYPSAIRSAGNINYPANQDEAKFSIKYGVAVALVRGKFALDDLMVEKESCVLSKLIDITDLIPTEEMLDVQAGIRGSKVRIHLDDGQIFEEYIPLPKGEGSFILEWFDLKEKLSDCSRHTLENGMSDKILELCKNITPDDYYYSITDEINNLAYESSKLEINSLNGSFKIIGGGYSRLKTRLSNQSRKKYILPFLLPNQYGRAAKW